MRDLTTILCRAFATLLLAATAVWADPAGTLTGTVTLAGTPPKRPLLQVFKHEDVCGKGVPDDRLVVGTRGGLRYAVVTVEGVRGGRTPERDVAIVLDNRLCRFEPHVQVAEVGQSIDLHNSDPILHNADARIGAETLFNVALTPERHLRRPLARAGLVTIVCDVRHTWMKAFIDVADHPYHTVTDINGEYEIRDIPPGQYTMRVWHEELGTREQAVVITGGATTTADTTYPTKETTPVPPGQ